VLDVPAEEFARDVLHARMRVRLVVVGENFRFGRGGTGRIATLRRLGSSAGLDGIEVGMVMVGGEAVSATRIRDHLAVGDVARASELLGRPYEVVGWLSAYGRSTATVLVAATRAVPAPGRYLASVALRGRVGGPTAAAVAVHAAEGPAQPRGALVWRRAG
jgi:riboflavin kinase/FMN adenylyltransferase